jgi:hypothetical protein
MKASLSPFPVLRANVLLLKGICDWAVVLYDADSIAHVKSICKMVDIIFFAVFRKNECKTHKLLPSSDNRAHDAS